MPRFRRGFDSLRPLKFGEYVSNIVDKEDNLMNLYDTVRLRDIIIKSSQTGSDELIAKLGELINLEISRNVLEALGKIAIKEEPQLNPPRTLIAGEVVILRIGWTAARKAVQQQIDEVGKAYHG